MKFTKLVSVLVLLPALFMPLFIVTANEGEHGLLRIGHFAADAPSVDVYLNGEILAEDVTLGVVTDFMEVEPGTASVAITSTGESLDNAVIAPWNVEIESAHRYSISVIGHSADNSLMPLLIDETAAMEGCDLSKNVFRIIVNNIAGGPPVSFYEQGEWMETNLEPGTYSAGCYPAFFWDTAKAVVGDDLNNILFDFDSEADGNGGYWEPYTVYFWGLMGSYPGAPDEDYYFGGGNWYVIAPDVLTFLSAFTGLGLTGDSQVYFEFDRFIEAVKTAGLEDMLLSGGPYTLFVPTDQAFEALPQATLDALMADPEMLKDVLLYHVVEGDMSYDDLLGAGTITTLQGADLTITGPESEEDFHLYLNGDTRISDFDYPLTNGSRIWFIDNLSVLMPPSE